MPLPWFYRFSHDFSVLRCMMEEAREAGAERKGKNSCGNIENNLLARAEDACIVAYREM